MHCGLLLRIKLQRESLQIKFNFKLLQQQWQQLSFNCCNWCACSERSNRSRSVGLWLRVHYASVHEADGARDGAGNMADNRVNRWHIELIAQVYAVLAPCQQARRRSSWRSSSSSNKFNSIPIRLLSMRWLRERIRHVVSNWNTVDTVGKYFSVRQKDDGEFLSICVRVRVARQLCVVASAAAAAVGSGSDFAIAPSEL